VLAVEEGLRPPSCVNPTECVSEHIVPTNAKPTVLSVRSIPLQMYDKRNENES
jgi:hypothetical protein